MDWLQIKNEANETIIDITGVIGDSWSDNETTHESVYETIKKIKDLTSSKITVNIINSPGGSVPHALAIYDLLTTSKAKVVTNGYGVVASAATIIFMAGSKGYRNLSPNMKWLTHRMTVGLQGNTDQIKTSLSDAEKWEKDLVEIMVNASGGKLNSEMVWSLMNEDEGNGLFKDAEEVINYGFADKIMTTYKMVALIDNATLESFKLPKIENNNQINTEMDILTEIKNQLLELKNAILGQKPADTKEQVEPKDYSNELAAIENKITEVEAANTQLATDLQAKDTAITEAQNKIAELEAENLVLKQAAGTDTNAAVINSSNNPLNQKETLSQDMIDSLNAVANKRTITSDKPFE